MDRSEPVWITGVGLSTPLGSDLDSLDRNLLDGRSGVGEVTRFPTADYPCRIAAQIGEVPRPGSLGSAEFSALHPLERLAFWCVESAWVDAGAADRRGARVGLVLGLGGEWLELWEADAIAGGSKIADPEQDRRTTVDRVARHLGFEGPNLTLSAACASGNFAIEIGRAWLRMGLVDVCLAGGCEMAVTPISLASFGNLRALSRRNSDPAAASRPFDRARDGFVLGEGGAVFALERASDARERSARALAEVAGFGASSDAHHCVIPSPDPAPAASAVRRALEDARIDASRVDHINAHATGTPIGDAGEAVVLRSVFGDLASSIPVTSTKSMTGHLLAAAGAVEALACLTAIRHAAIPPTINLDDPDVDLRLVANEARPHAVRVAVSNSFGFGGSNTCLVLRSV